MASFNCPNLGLFTQNEYPTASQRKATFLDSAPSHGLEGALCLEGLSQSSRVHLVTQSQGPGPMVDFFIVKNVSKEKVSLAEI